MFTPIPALRNCTTRKRTAPKKKKQLPLVVLPQAARRRRSIGKSAVSASRLGGAMKLLTDKVLRFAIHWRSEAHVALFTWTVKALTIERERGAKSPTPSKGCDSWRSLAQPCGRTAQMPDVFPPSRTPTVLQRARCQCTTRRQCRHYNRGPERGRPCASSPWRLDTNTNILHELHSHTIVRNRILADETNSQPRGQNGKCHATRLQRKGDAATKRDGDVVGSFRDHPSAKGNRIRPSGSSRRSDRRGAEDTASFAGYINTLPNWLAEEMWTITLSFMGLRTTWTDWPHGYTNEHISFLIMTRSCRPKRP